jgi:uncharacterized membrane protein
MDYLQFWGIDWIAMVLTFLAIWQIGNKNKIGFFLMMGGNTSWIGVGYLMGSMAMIIANIIFLSMNLRAIIKWSSTDKKDGQSTKR